MEEEEKKDNNTLKDGFKKGVLGFVKVIFDYIKGIVAILLILLGLSAFRLIERETTYLPIGIILIILGLMAAPRVSEMTKKFEKYTKYKIFIVITLTVIAVLLFMLAGYRMSN